MQKVKAYISENPICSYREIAQATGEQITMVSSCIRYLIRDKHIERQQHFTVTGGAAKNSYRILSREGLTNV